MYTELAFATVTVRVTGAPAAIVSALAVVPPFVAVMLTVVAVEGCTVMGVFDEAVRLPVPLAVAVYVQVPGVLGAETCCVPPVACKV